MKLVEFLVLPLPRRNSGILICKVKHFLNKLAAQQMCELQSLVYVFIYFDNFIQFLGIMRDLSAGLLDLSTF